MHVTQTINETREHLSKLRRIAFVPTMGALHEGHLSLMRQAKALGDHVVVSIFVNPTQFAAHEDLSKYPKPIERDLALCEQVGVDVVFNPTMDVVYPADELDVTVDVPALTGLLEGAHRPGHFVGVCRVVAKLLSIVQPAVAVFGRKDYQQLKVIEAMVRGLCLPVKIVAGPTVREADGLAMSSRNVYLSGEQRKDALSLSRALREAGRMIADGVLDPGAIEQAMRMQMQTHRVTVDYAVVRGAHNLCELDVINTSIMPVVCLVAGRVGATRLIDNCVIGDGS